MPPVTIKDFSILQTLVGRSIEEFRRRAFHMDGALVDGQILLFIKVDGSWHAIGFCDGEMSLRHLQEEPLLDRHDGVEADFAYPTFAVEQLHKYVDRKVQATYLYKASIPTEDIFGIYVGYDDGGFSYIQDASGDHCYFRDGTIDENDEDFELLSADILLED